MTGMNFTLADWFDDLTQSSRYCLTETIKAQGIRDSWADPGFFGRIDVIAEPADHWSVAIEIPSQLADARYAELFLKEAVFGILDSLLTSHLMRPVIGVRLRIVGMQTDPVRSNQAAFRLAGRDAGAKILSAAGELRRLAVESPSSPNQDQG